MLMRLPVMLQVVLLLEVQMEAVQAALRTIIGECGVALWRDLPARCGYFRVRLRR